MSTTQAPAAIELTEDELKLFAELGTSIETAAEQDANEAADAVAAGLLQIKRGVTEGPLVGLTPVFIDWETKMGPDLSLASMTLRQYLLATRSESVSICIGEKDPAQVFFHEEFPGDIPADRRIGKNLIETLRFVCNDPNYVIVAHNAAFDTRAGVYLYGLPYPQNVWCTMEGAMGAWPELPGGFGLENCSRKLGLPRDLRKFPLDLKWMAKARLAALDNRPYEVAALEALDNGFIIQCRAILRSVKEKLPSHLTINVLNRVLELYNKRDTESAREIYYRQIARIHPREQGVALRTHRQRKFQLCIDADRLNNLIETLEGHAEYARKQAGEYLTDEQLGEVFNVNSGLATSVRYQRLRTVINEIKQQEDDEFVSSSLKKINPIMLSRNPGVQAVLEQTTRVGKMLSHKRRATIFKGIDRVDVELGYMRAHTGRFSSPSVGKGFNLHNVPKHDKLIAEPVRKCYRVSPDLCLVRADLANVEYRIEGMLTKCKTVINMFDTSKGGNIFNDPYCLAWKSMTGILIDKKDPVRQVSKSAVLGLGFCMAVAGYARVLLGVLASKQVTEEGLAKIIADNRWTMPEKEVIVQVRNRLGAVSLMVITAAYHIHRTFNQSHPEFGEAAAWLVDTVSAVASQPEGLLYRDQARRVIDRMYTSTRAPDRDLIGLEIDDDPLFGRASIRVKCGPWPATVCWREPAARLTDFSGASHEKKLTIMKAMGFWKPFTKQLAIENVTQAAARNAMCMGVEELERLGWPDVVHIHDEIMIICKRDRQTVLAARDALTQAFGPNHKMPHKWAILVKPEEITVTESMWEEETDIMVPTEKNKFKGNDRWGKIERNEAGCLENLP